jgi:hypothetical protein
MGDFYSKQITNNKTNAAKNHDMIGHKFLADSIHLYGTCCI